MWNKKFKECIRCKRTKYLFKAKGLCRNCYGAVNRKKWADSAAQYRNKTRFNGYRDIVIQRDKVCKFCKKETDLVVHHLDYSNTPDKLIVLCRSCHTLYHNYLRLKEIFKNTQLPI